MLTFNMFFVYNISHFSGQISDAFENEDKVRSIQTAKSKASIFLLAMFSKELLRKKKKIRAFRYC